MTVAVVLASLVPILRETGIGSDVMKPIAAPIVGGLITSTIHASILVPVFFAMIKGRAIPARPGGYRDRDFEIQAWSQRGRVAGVVDEPGMVPAKNSLAPAVLVGRHEAPSNVSALASRT